MTQDRPGDPPCFAHQLVGVCPVDPDTWRDVARFRRAELDLRFLDAARP